MYKLLFKRLTDIIIAIIGLIILSPIFLVIMMVLFFINSGRPFFYQERPGYLTKAFKVIKFKTMTDAKDFQGNLLPNHLRTTKFGRFLRKSSLDEIPQLINVLKGDMSIVGPRPLLFKYLPLYNKDQQRRHEVKPGITGLAQVSGRNAISWTEKFKFDVIYVESYSFRMDLKIIIRTIYKVLRSEGVNKSEKITSEPFNGNN